MKPLCLWAILAEGFDAKASIAPRFAFVLSCFLLGCAAYNPTPQQGIQMPNKEAPFQKWLLFYEEQFRLNGDNTPMPPSDAPEVAWQAYSAAKNNYTAEKAGKKVDEQAIGAMLGVLAGILVVIILMQMGK